MRQTCSLIDELEYLEYEEAEPGALRARRLSARRGGSGVLPAGQKSLGGRLPPVAERREAAKAVWVACELRCDFSGVAEKVRKSGGTSCIMRALASKGGGGYDARRDDCETAAVAYVAHD